MTQTPPPTEPAPSGDALAATDAPDDPGAPGVRAAAPVSAAARRAPRPDATWAVIRDAYLAGVSGPELARRCGVGLSTLRARAKTEGWRRVDAAAAEALIAAPVPGPAAAAEPWPDPGPVRRARPAAADAPRIEGGRRDDAGRDGSGGSGEDAGEDAEAPAGPPDPLRAADGPAVRALARAALETRWGRLESAERWARVAERLAAAERAIAALAAGDVDIDDEDSAAAQAAARGALALKLAGA